MKKSELKNIIKECVKEVIFEEGVLSGIIAEVATGLSSTQLVERTARPSRPAQRSPESQAARNRVMAEVGNNSYADIKQKFKNPELFEGTEPIPEGKGQGALSGISPGDSGLDISSIPGFGSWGAIAETKK